MRGVFKWSFGSALAGFLVLALLYVTSSWWLPAAFQRWVPDLLQAYGVSASELVLKEWGQRGTVIEVRRLHYEGVAVADAELRLEYRLKELFRGRVGKVILQHPIIEVDLSKQGVLGRLDERAPEVKRDQGPLPIAALEIRNAMLRLRGEQWSRSFEITALITQKDRWQGQFSMVGAGVQAQAETELSWPELSASVKGTATIEEPANWLRLAREQSWIRLDEAFSVRSGTLVIEVDGQLDQGQLKAWNGKGYVQSVHAAAGEARCTVQTIEARLFGESMEIKHLELRINQGNLYWAGDAGQLIGLEGTLGLDSLFPVVTADWQTLRFASVRQGEFATEGGTLRFISRALPEAGQSLELECTTAALGGRVCLMVKGDVVGTGWFDVEVKLDQVALDQVSALFPDFEGRIEGKASGALALRLEGKRLVLLPGQLELLPDSVGRFVYARRGWLTQNPDLDVEAFVRERGVVEIMQEPQGASILTELALRDLTMTEFTLNVLPGDSMNERVMVRIKGHSQVKEVEVPVVLDVPIRGDVKETINTVLRLNARY